MAMSSTSYVTRTAVSSLNRMYDRKTDRNTLAEPWRGPSQEAGTTP